jgi:CBS domain-containing protein
VFPGWSQVEPFLGGSLATSHFSPARSVRPAFLFVETSRFGQQRKPMEIAGTVSALLREKDRPLCSIDPGATVYAAIELMASKNIGALPVLDSGKLVGMLSERDYTRKVILQGRSSRNTPVSEIMTREPRVVQADDSIGDCMRLMTEERVRHLPVVEAGELIGILSIGDLVKWIISAQTATIDQLTKYIYGET